MVLIFFIAVIAIIIALIIDAGGIELLLLIIGLIIVFIALMIALAIYCSNAENEESKPRFAAKPISAELERIDNMNGLEFENYTARLLRQLGYTNVEVTKSSGDFGVDIVAHNGGEKCVIQCKRYSKNLGIKPIQEVYSGKEYYKATTAIVISNSYYTESAHNLARELGVRLYDRNSLKEMIIMANRLNESSNKISVKPEQKHLNNTESESSKGSQIALIAILIFVVAIVVIFNAIYA